MDILNAISKNRLWRSVVRQGIRPTNRNRILFVTESVLLHFHSAKVRRRHLEFSSTFFLGAISLILFAVLVVTGVVLMLYYHPSVQQAYSDMKELEFVVSNGVFLRNMHRWAAHGMVFMAFAHMLRVFYHKAYIPPREFNWVVGVVLLLVTLLLSYTGYLLPWDQLAFWGVSVGTNMAKAVPLIGDEIRYLLLGGNIVGENALLRFYVLHCVVLPLVFTMGIGVHMWRVRKDGLVGSANRSQRYRSETRS